MQDREIPCDRFGDSDAMADELGALAIAGIKTATCWAYDPAVALPKPGDRTVMQGAGGRNLCIIETLEVRLVPFSDVDAQFACEEGEGDRSLASWRRMHQDYFERNGGFRPDMILACERFRIVEVF